ncbi:MAG: hypothetical protein QXW70_00785 [Candidatus Anstonellales archaeon]
MAEKKGVAATASVILLLSILLYLSYYLSLYSSSLYSSSTLLSEFETAGVNFDSIDQAVRETTKRNAIDVSQKQTNLSIAINSSRLPTYFETLGATEKFLRLQPELNSNIITDNHSVVVILTPLNITLNYSSSRFLVAPTNQQQDIPNISFYEISLLLQSPTPSINWSYLSELEENDPSALRVRIAIQGTNGTTYSQKYVSRTLPSRADLLNSQGIPIININVNPSSTLNITWIPDTYIKINAGLNSAVVAELKSVVINTSINKWGYKSRGVILSED